VENVAVEGEEVGDAALADSAEVARDGMAVVCVSSEIEELLALSHRVLVLRHGRPVGEFPRGTAKEVVIAAAFGDEGEPT
jgi:ribose transport system ATP-binding protein